MDAAIRIGREEGMAAFWRGSMPFVNRAILVGACQVGTYDQFRDMYADADGCFLPIGANPTPSSLTLPSRFKKAGVPAGLPEVFCASMASGLLYSLITMPFETAKNRMAFQKAGPDGKFLYTVRSRPGGQAIYRFVRSMGR